MNNKYSDQQLIDGLNYLLNKYGKIQTKLIDKDKNVPNRKAYIRRFGSVQKACEYIGYKDYKKGKYTIKDAQKELDKRNGHFILLNFNGMKEKNLTKCKDCGYEWEVTTDSLLRAITRTKKRENIYGCPNCFSKQKPLKILPPNDINYQIKELNDIKQLYPRIDGKGYVYRIINLINNKTYIGSSIDPSERFHSHYISSINENCPTYNYPLYKAFRKYGIDNFAFEILEKCYISEMQEKEKNYIILYNSLTNEGWGYNQTLDTENKIRLKEFIKGQKCALINDDGEILQIYSSYHEAALKIFGDREKATSICAVCNGRAKHYKKNKFIKINDEMEGD